MEAVKLIMILSGMLITLLILFFVPILILDKKTKKIFKEKPNYYSKIKVDVNKKIVHISPVKSNSNEESEIYSLDDFIYMISITPDSKNLRELFKLIVNEKSEDVILEKIKTLESLILFTFEREGGKRSYASFFVNKSINDVKNLYFEMTETYIKNRDKEIKIFKNEISLINDKKIFSLLYKDINNIKSKGWVIVKISYKYEKITTQKARKSRILESNKIKAILESHDITSYISKDSSVFAVFSPGKISSNLSIQKHFNVYVNSLLAPSKDKKQNIDIQKHIISTVNDSNKTQTALNFNLIKLQLISDAKLNNKFSDELNVDIFQKTKSISDSSNEISDNTKGKNTWIKSSKIEVFGKKKMKFDEYFLDFDQNIVNEILIYSWKNKIQIMTEVINYVNKESKKTPNVLSYFSFNVSLINEIVESIKDIKRNDNFFILLENETKNFDNVYLKQKINILKENGFDIILKLDSLDREDLNEIIYFEPKYIFFSKNFSKELGNEKIALESFRKIIKLKNNDTKIFTIK